MTAFFNAEEVLEMAERIERNGQGFYLQAASMVQGTDTGKLLADLAVWEKGHEALFKAMRNELSGRETEQTAFDPEGELALYLQAMADSHVFAIDGMNPAELLDGSESEEDILDIAIEFERSSILFFMGLQKMVSPVLGRERVWKVIDEETSHVAYLEKKRSEI
jgi:rubrerythrin